MSYYNKLRAEGRIEEARAIARRYYALRMADTNDKYIHNCGKTFDHAAQAFVHLLEPCESLIYKLF